MGRVHVAGAYFSSLVRVCRNTMLDSLYSLKYPVFAHSCSGSVTQLKVEGDVIVTENTQEQWDLGYEDAEGVLCIDKNGKPSIMSRTVEGEKWRQCDTYLHTGPILLLDGVRQPFDHKTWNHVRNPRTAVCTRTKNSNEAFLLTVDGRYPTSTGMTIPELAQFMQALGCEDAINMDGGGSTTAWTKEFGMVNEPRQKVKEGYDMSLTERGVSNCMLVL